MPGAHEVGLDRLLVDGRGGPLDGVHGFPVDRLADDRAVAHHQLGRAPFEAGMAHAGVARRCAPTDRLGLQERHPSPELCAAPRGRTAGQPAADDHKVRDVGKGPPAPVRLRRELRLPEHGAFEGPKRVGGRCHRHEGSAADGGRLVV